MKRMKNCEVENCIPTPSSCIYWNGGDVKSLGVCNGDQINNLLWEIITKLQDIAGEDISQFDLDDLLEICKIKAPSEVTLISILEIVKKNQVCLKDYIEKLNDKLNELFSESDIKVNLKCYTEFDNLGNALSITREQLDQLIIDELCEHENRIDVLEGKVINLQNQINNININPSVNEPEFSTCIDSALKPTSGQTVSIANALCDLRNATGTSGQINSALSNTPPPFSTLEYQSLPGWIINPSNLAENYSNLLIAFNYIIERLTNIENNCCAPDCNDVELGFSAMFDEDGTSVIIKFTSGAGTNIPSGFVDIGSTITIKDKDGNVETFTTSAPDLIENNAEIEIPVTTLNLNGDLTISIQANISNGTLVCSKCLSKVIKKPKCKYCEICAQGTNGYVILVYEVESPT